MFARLLEFGPKMEKKEEFIRVVRNEVLPILKKQHGFLDVLPFLPEIANEKMILISLWVEKKDAERYHKEWFPRVEEIVRPYLSTPINFKTYMVETSVCEHFEKAMVV